MLCWWTVQLFAGGIINNSHQTEADFLFPAVHPFMDGWISEPRYPSKLILRAWQDTWITLHLNKELNHMESCLLWKTAQTCRLSFGLTQAVGDQEPNSLDYPGCPSLLWQQIMGLYLSEHNSSERCSNTRVCESGHWPGRDAMQWAAV